MGDLLFCQVPHLGFCLIILLALSLCYGNHVTVNVEGFIECAHCIPVGFPFSEASSGTGLLMKIECKSRGGDLRRLGAGEVDNTGNFKTKFLQDKNVEDQAERGSCFLKLDGASGAPCPAQDVQNVLVMISKSIDNVIQTSATIWKLKFSSMTCTSAILWPSNQNNEELIDIPPSPGKTLQYLHQSSVKYFLSTKSGLMEIFPASVKNNLKPLSSLMSRKLLSLPHHFFFGPTFPSPPVIQYHSPELTPPLGNQTPTSIPTTKPLQSPTPASSNYKPSQAPTSRSPKLLQPPTPMLKKPVLAPPPVSRMPSVLVVSLTKKPPPPSRPNLEKPLPPVPPPMPHLYKPLPPMAQASEIMQSLPPLAPYMKEPPSQLTPTYKNAPSPHSQRLVPSTAPAPLVETPHFPPLAPTYENLIPVPAPTPHLKKPIPPVAPVPTYKRPKIPPPMNSPGPILQKPNPPPVPTFKKSAPPPHPPIPVQQPNAPLHPPLSPKPATPAPSHSARPVLQKPNTPPVPTSPKVTPPLPSPKSPVHPPISPTPMSHPSPKPADKSAPPPLPIINPTPPNKQHPSPPAPRQKSFYPIPKAPPIPQLPPVPTVPRRYFNLPKYGSQPSSPPS